ncbi:transcription factor myb, partial [Acrasis kona]
MTDVEDQYEMTESSDDESQDKLSKALSSHHENSNHSLIDEDEDEDDVIQNRVADILANHTDELELEHDIPLQSASRQLPTVIPSNNTYERLLQALELNRQYKNSLQEQLIGIQESQQRNSALQREVRIRMVQQRSDNPGRMIAQKRFNSSLQKKTASSLFFSIDDKNAKLPQDNPDAIRRKVKQDKMPLIYNFKKWGNNEIKKLKEVLHQQVQEIFMTKVLNKHKDNHNRDSIGVLFNDMKDIERMSEDEYEKVINEINWEKISDLVGKHRTPYECEKKWKNELSSRINRKKWTHDEDRLLLQLANENKSQNWPSIAKLVGDRPTIHVLQRFQRSLNVNMMKSKW